MGWAHIGSSVAAAFLGSLVEFVEALTIVLAVGTVRGWRSALAGAGAGVAFLAALVLAFGRALDLVPLEKLQLLVGCLLLLFGARWLRKAVLRAAAIIPLHDEAAAYSHETDSLRSAGVASGTWDTIAVVTSFKAVVLEGIEVVFIVIAVGATPSMLVPASIGAAAAGIIVVFLGLVLHRPLAQVPENTLKFAVGVLISAFGVFWIGEGLGLEWPGGDLAILGLNVVFLAVALVLVGVLRRRPVAQPVVAGPGLEIRR